LNYARFAAWSMLARWSAHLIASKCAVYARGRCCHTGSLRPPCIADEPVAPCARIRHSVSRAVKSCPRRIAVGGTAVNSGIDKRAAPRSFVRRSGRITVAQKRALKALWPKYGVEGASLPLSLSDIFGREASTVLEIGFGSGETLVRAAAESPNLNFLGVEVHLPGLGRCLLGAERAGISNLRLIQADAMDVLQAQLPPAAVAMACLYFPDPWPRKRHHKRRLVQPGFVALLARALEPGGVFHVATDWAPYAEHIEGVMDAVAAFERLGQPPARHATRFESRGSALGHEIWEAAYRLRPPR